MREIIIALAVLVLLSGLLIAAVVPVALEMKTED